VIEGRAAPDLHRVWRHPQRTWPPDRTPWQISDWIQALSNTVEQSKVHDIMSEHERDEAKSLREKAEASAARRRVSEAPELSSEQAGKLVHELQVHQIELEIQNEELRRVMGELEQSRNQFSLLFHQAPIGYLVLNDVGLIHEVNETFCRMVS
jgi:PAS domain-containing protein